MFSVLVDGLIGLDDAALTERFRSLELQRRRIEAEMAAIVREGERRAIQTVDGHRSMKHWVRAQTNCPVADAARLRRLAAALDDIGGAGDALLDGHIGVAQADELARVRSNPRCGDRVGEVSAILLEHAEHLSFEQFRTVTRRWETLADLDGAQADDDVSHARRTASVIELHGAVDVRASGGSGHVAAELIGIFRQFVDAEFAKDVAALDDESAPDAPRSALPRTDAQRRFDALAAIFRTAVLAPANGVAPKPVVNLLVGYETVERVVARWGSDPASLSNDPGGAPDLLVERMESTSGVPIAPADALAAMLTGAIRRVVVDPSGVVVDAGRKRRLFTGAARELALLLAHECGHLGCTVPAERCHVDHLDEWQQQGGPTDQANAGPRCAPHNSWKSTHRLRPVREDPRFRYDVREDGSPMLPVGRRATVSADGFPTYRTSFCTLRTAHGRDETRRGLLASISPDSAT